MYIYRTLFVSTSGTRGCRGVSGICPCLGKEEWDSFRYRLGWWLKTSNMYISYIGGQSDEFGSECVTSIRASQGCGEAIKSGSRHWSRRSNSTSAGPGDGDGDRTSKREDWWSEASAAAAAFAGGRVQGAIPPGSLQLKSAETPGSGIPWDHMIWDTISPKMSPPNTAEPNAGLFFRRLLNTSLVPV